tara:strand:+ start:383 stop:715 length:333 start_codon:yes stop_codon:yes gene_type:complete
MASSEESFKHMQISELHKVLADESHVVVDIRDPASFQSGHIPNAIHLSNESLADFLRDADFDAPVVVCCYHGISSQQAALFLISQDFTEVYSLDGGFTDWQLQHPDVVTC